MGWYTQIPDTPDTSVTHYFTPTNEDHVPYIDVEFLEGKGVVEAITMNWSEFQGNPFSSDNLQQLFLDSVLTRYGKPSRILLGLNAARSEPGAPYLYQLWLFYDDKGMLFEYEGTALQGQPIKVCPSLRAVTTLSLFLISTDRDLTFDRYIGSDFNNQVAQGYLQPIDIAAGMTTTSFTDEFASLNNHPCFVSPDNIWP